MSEVLCSPTQNRSNGELLARFTGDGQAFHGTYWHENFGAPMSHGCINMRTSEAKWIYRWTTPAINVAALLNASDARSREMHGFGTSVNVHY